MQSTDTLYYKVPGTPDAGILTLTLPEGDRVFSDWYRAPIQHFDQDDLSDLLSYVARRYYNSVPGLDEAEWPLEFQFYASPDPGPEESPYYTARVNIRYVAQFEADLSEPPPCPQVAPDPQPDVVPTGPPDNLGLTPDQVRDAYLTGKKVRYWDTKDHRYYGWFREGFVGKVLLHHTGFQWEPYRPAQDCVVIVKPKLPLNPDRPDPPSLWSVGPPFPISRCEFTDDPPCPVRAACVAAYEAEKRKREDMEYRAAVFLAQERRRDDD